MRDDSEPIHPLERKPDTAEDLEMPAPPPRISWSERFRRMKRMWGVWVLILVNSAIFILGGIDGDSINLRAQQGGLNTYMVLAEGQYYRIVTAMFLHGSIIHLAFNMLALHNIGSWVEMMFGHRRFWVIYVLSGLGGSLFGTLLSNMNVYSVGVSGSIMGLIGALIVFFFRHSKLLDTPLREVRRSLVVAAVMTLGVGLLPGSIIDNWGHIGGFVIGATLGYGIAPYYVVVSQTNPSTGEVKKFARDTMTLPRQNLFITQTVVMLIGLLLFIRVFRPF